MEKFTPKKIVVLILSGMLIGLVICVQGWAAPVRKTASKPAKVAKKAHKKPAKKTVVVQRPAARPALKSYAHPDAGFGVRYPSGWQVTSSNQAMVMKSSNNSQHRAVFGIVRRPDDQPNDEAILKAFNSPNRPVDLVRMPARVAGMPAIKVIGTDKNDSNSRTVEYYVQDYEGRQYYILLMAPRQDWKNYQVAFNTMLETISFN